MDIEEEIERAFQEWWNAPMPDDGSTVDISVYLMPLVKRAQAEALRDAAEFLNEKFQDIPAWVEAYREGVRTDEWMQGGVRMTMSAIQVLNDRADRIEKEAGE